MIGSKVLEGPGKRRFRSLVEIWKRDVALSSSLSERLSHPAYQEVIEMGAAAIPYLLAELEREPDWWFMALKKITGTDPVPPTYRGRLMEMTQAWLQWGRKNGYEW